jgi:FG-GAP repeat
MPNARPMLSWMWGLVLVCLLGAGSLWAQGDVSFPAARVTPTPGTSVAVAGGDFNGDGRLDLAVANNSSNTVSILLNTTPQTFSRVQMSRVPE